MGRESTLPSESKGRTVRGARRSAARPQPLIAELRAETKEQRDNFGRQASELATRQEETRRRLSQEKADKIIATFPKKAREAAAKGEDNVHLGPFGGDELGVLDIVCSWLNGQGFITAVSHNQELPADESGPEHKPSDFITVSW